MSLNYQLVGYNWSPYHWENKQVSRWTQSNINHVALRIGKYETLVNQYGSQWRKTSTLQRAYSMPLITTAKRTMSRAGLQAVTDVVANYGPMNRPYIYLYNFTGRFLPVPKSCTDLTWHCLRALGVDLKERFLPNTLLKEFYTCK